MDASSTATANVNANGNADANMAIVGDGNASGFAFLSLPPTWLWALTFLVLLAGVQVGFYVQNFLILKLPPGYDMSDFNLWKLRSIPFKSSAMPLRQGSSILADIP